jgi:hypothetical protein
MNAFRTPFTLHLYFGAMNHCTHVRRHGARKHAPTARSARQTRPHTYEPARATYMRTDRACLSSYPQVVVEGAHHLWGLGAGGGRGGGAAGGAAGGRSRIMAVGTRRSRLWNPGASTPRLERNTTTPHIHSTAHSFLSQVCKEKKGTRQQRKALPPRF